MIYVLYSIYYHTIKMSKKIELKKGDIVSEHIFYIDDIIVHKRRICSFKCICWKTFNATLSSVRRWKKKSCWCKTILGDKLKKTIDIGTVINWCTYLWDIDYTPWTWRKWLFMCHCGNKFSALIGSIYNKHTRSCGCKQWWYKHWWRSNRSVSNYGIRRWIKTRCFNKNSKSRENYWWRWITMYHNRVTNFEAFEAYINTDLWKRPSKKHSIDRINNNGNYEPWNIRWALPIDQNRNYSNNIIIHYKWEKLCALDAWNKYVRNNTWLSWQWFYDRLSSGWPHAMAIEYPKTKWRFDFKKIAIKYT